MRGFKRSRGRIVARFDEGEAPLLANLVEQLIGLLEDMEYGSKPHLLSDDMADDFEGLDSFGFTECAELHNDAMQRVDEVADHFAEWEAEFVADTRDDFPMSTDPVISRLFPDAYKDDPESSAEFRHFTQATQRSAKMADAHTMLSDLSAVKEASAYNGHAVSFPAEHYWAWLKTANNLRLALSARIGIVDATTAMEIEEIADGDLRAPAVQMYNWLGWVLESLLTISPDSSF